MAIERKLGREHVLKTKDVGFGESAMVGIDVVYMSDEEGSDGWTYMMMTTSVHDDEDDDTNRWTTMDTRGARFRGRIKEVTLIVQESPGKESLNTETPKISLAILKAKAKKKAEKKTVE